MQVIVIQSPKALRGILRRLFGILLIAAGTVQIFKRPKGKS